MREKRNCFECGMTFYIENKADLEAFEMSGLCPNCRAEVFEDMYNDEIEFQLKRIADALEKNSKQIGGTNERNNCKFY